MDKQGSDHVGMCVFVWGRKKMEKFAGVIFLHSSFFLTLCCLLGWLAGCSHAHSALHRVKRLVTRTSQSLSKLTLNSHLSKCCAVQDSVSPSRTTTCYSSRHQHLCHLMDLVCPGGMPSSLQIRDSSPSVNRLQSSCVFPLLFQQSYGREDLLKVTVAYRPSVIQTRNLAG